MNADYLLSLKTFLCNPGLLTYGASLDLNVNLLSALGQCNRDKFDIRTIEQSRTSQ